MRILMLAHRIPYPPHTGDKIRAYHIARYLARRHRLTLAFLVDEAADQAGIEPLRREMGDVMFAKLWKPWSVAKGLAGLASGSSLTLPYFYSRGLQERVRQRVSDADFDLIYASSSPMAQYAGGSTLPLVMDFVDVDSDKWSQYADRTQPPRSWLYRAEGRRLQRYEAGIARRARSCLLATRVEEALLRSFAPRARTAVIPNGIDLEYYSPVETATESRVLIFTGAMDYLPNIDAVTYFCDEILPRVRQAVPDAVLHIVGLRPAPSVRRLGERPEVVVTGAVPDVRPYYARASVCVAPLRIARGIQNKVLQAMALGVPVVASSAAARGLDAEAGEHFHVEDEPAAFASRLVALLQSSSERRAVGGRGRAFVERHYSWEASFSRVEDVLEAAVRKDTAVAQP